MKPIYFRSTSHASPVIYRLIGKKLYIWTTTDWSCVNSNYPKEYIDLLIQERTSTSKILSEEEVFLELL